MLSEIVWWMLMSVVERCLRDVWETFGWCWEMFERCLRDVFEWFCEMFEDCWGDVAWVLLGMLKAVERCFSSVNSLTALSQTSLTLPLPQWSIVPFQRKIVKRSLIWICTSEFGDMYFFQTWRSAGARWQSWEVWLLMSRRFDFKISCLFFNLVYMVQTETTRFRTCSCCVGCFHSEWEKHFYFFRSFHSRWEFLLHINFHGIVLWRGGWEWDHCSNFNGTTSISFSSNQDATAGSAFFLLYSLDDWPLAVAWPWSLSVPQWLGHLHSCSM